MASIFVLIVFFAVTAGHLLLVSRWLRMYSPGHRWDGAELAFQTFAVGLGSLQAVLHVLAFTVGLSLARGLIGIAAVHAVAGSLLVIRRRRPALLPEARWQAHVPTGRGTSQGLSHTSSAGIVVVAALVVQWIIVSARSLAVIGIDADHYHVPYAVNIALGVPAFGALATPHLYPMATSVLAAWFILPLRDLLLVDLATLLPFLLAWFAIIRLFAEVTGRDGLAWGPPVALVLFATPLFQAAVPMSADLFYMAAFLALNVVLLKGCIHLRLDGVDLLSLAFSLGMLVGSKSVGVFSAVALVAVYGLITALRVLLMRRKFLWPGLSVLTAAMALVLIAASGGLWQIRNWWMFGSPIAPSGLSILGVQLFSGTSFESGMYYGSVLRDARDIEGYHALARFAYWVKIWLGPWFLPAGASVLWLFAGIWVALRRRHALPDTARTALVFAGATLVLTAAHLMLLAAAPWSSLESYQGLTLRYALPCLALYGLCAYCFLFATEMAWWSHRPAFVAGVMLVLASAWYVSHQAVNESLVDLTPARLTLTGLGIAAVVLVSWVGEVRLAPGAIRMAVRPGMIVLLATLAAIYVAGEDRAQVSAATAEFARLASSRDPANPHRDTYLAILAYERAAGMTCTRRRLFITTRFDGPLDLEPPRFENELLESRVTFDVSRMRLEGVGSGPCDYVIASQREIDSVRGVQLLNLLKPTGSLMSVGKAADFVVYAARSPEHR